jgi:hypothetical protein
MLPEDLVVEQVPQAQLVRKAIWEIWVQLDQVDPKGRLVLKEKQDLLDRAARELLQVV